MCVEFPNRLGSRVLYLFEIKLLLTNQFMVSKYTMGPDRDSPDHQVTNSIARRQGAVVPGAILQDRAFGNAAAEVFYVVPSPPPGAARRRDPR